MLKITPAGMMGSRMTSTGQDIRCIWKCQELPLRVCWRFTKELDVKGVKDGHEHEVTVLASFQSGLYKKKQENIPSEPKTMQDLRVDSEWFKFNKSEMVVSGQWSKEIFFLKMVGR